MDECRKISIIASKERNLKMNNKDSYSKEYDDEDETELEDSLEYKNPSTCLICGYIHDCLNYFLHCPFTKEKIKDRAKRGGIKTLEYMNESLQRVKEANLESDYTDIVLSI